MNRITRTALLTLTIACTQLLQGMQGLIATLAIKLPTDKRIAQSNREEL